ncbi:MAG TPA: hypothetical protein VIM58_10975 [Candidatus Methylacidiphilales bacterium]
MNRTLLYVAAAVVAAFIVIAAALSTTGGDSGSKNDELDQRMQAYMNCILTGDKSGFLDFFSRNNNWRFISYRAVTHATVRNVSFSYNDTAREMAREGGLWTAFFSGTDQYRYRDRIADHPLSKWVRDETHSYTIPRSEGVISFVRWGRDDDGRWIIKIIGDDSP